MTEFILVHQAMRKLTYGAGVVSPHQDLSSEQELAEYKKSISSNENRMFY